MLAVSGHEEERAQRAHEDWGIAGLDVGYGLSIERMREWGLFVSAGITDEEPAQFGEPGLFLVSPDGRVFYEALSSMPFGRPPLGEIRGGVDASTLAAPAASRFPLATVARVASMNDDTPPRSSRRHPGREARA